jgi:hypothetical protein
LKARVPGISKPQSPFFKGKSISVIGNVKENDTKLKIKIMCKTVLNVKEYK